MENLFFSFVLLFSSFGLSDIASSPSSYCTPPVNLSISAQSQNTINFDWDDSAFSDSEFAIYYTKDGQTSSIYTTNKSEISFAGLPAGTYRFYFYSVCGGTASSIIIEDVMIG